MYMYIFIHVHVHFYWLSELLAVSIHLLFVEVYVIIIELMWQCCCFLLPVAVGNPPKLPDQVQDILMTEGIFWQYPNLLPETGFGKQGPPNFYTPISILVST